MIGTAPLAAKNMAGPGHNPAVPQPIPKHMEPAISCASMFLLVGIAKLLDLRGHEMA